MAGLLDGVRADGAGRALVDSSQPPAGLRRGGNGYLRARMRNFCQLARHEPLLLITDLDSWPCPAALCSQWLRGLARPSTMLVRVAVREVESWLLADHEAIEILLGRRPTPRLPMQTDRIANPKAFLLGLACKAAREVRLDLCTESGAEVRQGIGYNARLGGFVREAWDPQRAAQRSDSLRRARQRLRELAESAAGKL